VTSSRWNGVLGWEHAGRSPHLGLEGGVVVQVEILQGQRVLPRRRTAASARRVGAPCMVCAADLGLIDAYDGVDRNAVVDVGVDARVQTPVPVPARAWASATSLRKMRAYRASEKEIAVRDHSVWGRSSTESMLAALFDHLLIRYPVFLL
jgi:hypothetical protein